MNKLVQGYGRTSVMLTELTTVRNGRLTSEHPFHVDVRYHYVSGHPATEFEPEAPEEFSVLNVSMRQQTWLDKSEEAPYTMPAHEDFLERLSAECVEDIITTMCMQCRGAVKQVYSDKYKDPDNLRPAPDERARRELGFHLR